MRGRLRWPGCPHRTALSPRLHTHPTDRSRSHRGVVLGSAACGPSDVRPGSAHPAAGGTAGPSVFLRHGRCSPLQANSHSPTPRVAPGSARLGCEHSSPLCHRDALPLGRRWFRMPLVGASDLETTSSRRRRHRWCRYRCRREVEAGNGNGNGNGNSTGTSNGTGTGTGTGNGNGMKPDTPRCCCSPLCKRGAGGIRFCSSFRSPAPRLPSHNRATPPPSSPVAHHRSQRPTERPRAMTRRPLKRRPEPPNARGCSNWSPAGSCRRGSRRTRRRAVHSAGRALAAGRRR
jgi:hypothetical protein